MLFKKLLWNKKHGGKVMILYPICSSSKGNCSYVSNGEVAILIDVGVGFKALVKSLKLAGLDEKKIRAIFITHEHYDHVKGLYAVTKNLNVPVYSSKETLKELILKNCIYYGTKMFEINKKTANIFGINVSAFNVLHDSVKGVRFKIECEGKKLAVCTDLGEASLEIINNLKDSNFVFLESNYDVKMLKEGKYPAMLKRRIASKYGHLSNLDAAFLINNLINFGVKEFLIGHLSEKNNLPQIALKTIILHLMKNNKKFMKDYNLYVAPVKNNGTKYEI